MIENVVERIDNEIMKTCICSGFCEYKMLGMYIGNCSYKSYCDYQTPKDSRERKNGIKQDKTSD